jgi:hypothetical protein
MAELVTLDVIENKIYTVRGKKVMLDYDLALLYHDEAKALKRAVRRNRDRFPDDFMFELNKDEYDSLRSQFGALKRGQHAKYLPYAFTEQGVAMLSSVLNSKLAIQINIRIMRAFVRMKNLVADNTDLRKAIEHIEKRLDVHDQQIKIAFAALKSILQPEPETPPQLPAKEYSPGKEKKMGFGKASGKR